MPTNPTSWGAGGGGSADASQYGNVVTASGFMYADGSGPNVALPANSCFGSRVIVPRTGTLRDLTVYIVASSGNLVAGILDTSATTRNRLYHTGSIPSPGTGWRTLGDPALAVTQGDHLDLYLGADNGVATFPFASVLAHPGLGKFPSGFFVSPLGGLPITTWMASAFPIGTTIAEASLTIEDASPVIMARIV